jgi:Zn-dependent oligopeptidase
MKKSKFKRWTPADVKQLRTLAKAKLSGVSIAKKLKRTVAATSQKASRLGIQFRSRG